VVTVSLPAPPDGEFIAREPSVCVPFTWGSPGVYLAPIPFRLDVRHVLRSALCGPGEIIGLYETEIGDQWTHI
jgi:hypothetical protein